MPGPEFSKPLAARSTPIPGVLLLNLPVHGDNRGWFKENWQREKMLAAGLPDFGPVQNNISFNGSVGTTRGIHAEPWDKFISVAAGSVFGAWVDLREGPSFGTTFTAVLDPTTAIFIPRGVGNAFQTLEHNTAYTYLVNDHWSADAQGQYTFLNLSDPSAAIKWPIPLSKAELSEKDRVHPFLADVAPMQPRRTLILGGDGQVGLALRRMYSDNDHVDFVTRSKLDLSSPDPFSNLDFSTYDKIVNAAAYTSVDAAETATGRVSAWAVNAAAVSSLATHCTRRGITLVHISSDYVFDGQLKEHHENEPFSPLGVYGASKAAGDAAAATVPAHYILRTSWVIGDGNNFVSTMASLAGRGVRPSVVNDQFGRLTFTEDIAAAIKHLLDVSAPFGTYNVSCSGQVQSWSDIAEDVYEILGHRRESVTGVSTAEYFAGKVSAARPAHSTLALTKLQSTGFDAPAARDRLRKYLLEVRN
ncbi:dTDP-4-dehydrorhamnose reductase/dTDP-4-dehydrorhamnose 3,5-epimerase [Arthrobacter sp. UYCu511]|uniref:bifunctional dTDP-4-dehydrorhamnose 3,5-epimerase family protein/NAD(P)-dependent oxidoreductase n=1 Tax=Arthrobacter sp. UYCu511 TaxID=3156337 RepID=UPI0033911C19